MSYPISFILNIIYNNHYKIINLIFSTMSEYKLFYFGGYARGEVIRLLLNHAGVQFEDVRFE